MGTRHLLTASPPRAHVTTAHRPPDDSERRPLSPWRDLRTAARHRHRVGPCGSCGRSLSPTAGRSHPSVPHTIPGFTEDNRVANQALVDLVRRVARRHNATPAQVALARPPGRRRRHPASRRRLRRGRRGGVYLLAVRHPGRPGALEEMARLVRAGGLLLADHVQAASWPVRAVQRLIELVTTDRSASGLRGLPPRWRRCADARPGGCHARLPWNPRVHDRHAGASCYWHGRRGCSRRLGLPPQSCCLRHAQPLAEPAADTAAPVSAVHRPGRRWIKQRSRPGWG